ncbi:alpha/beta hydrolase [Nocardia africana]|uniref:Alpha/beta hydrolase family n=1 Tax=Nocardia africana TaxID=134964 RepID=A0A378WQB4_9NOCA|nr:alpha/beta hydrolase [Nocardia africana]MCC3314302.1 alpha/beta hydrolase [Nocardia africana]SUA43438.1 Alpha/beta hydrolase family [Nocardia africana]
MRLRASIPTVLAAACLATAAFASAAAGPPLPGTVDLPCAATTLHQDAAWYRPAGTPRGLVWLQHGFARTQSNVAALAETLSAAGYLVFSPSLPFLNLDGCTLQNLGDNTAFLDQVARLFATAGDPTGPLATSAARAGVGPTALPRPWVFIGHSAGAEAVEYVAHRLHDSSPAAWANLRGLVLLDPVKSFLGDNTDVALADLAATDLPVLTVSGPPALCNNFGSGTAALRAHLHRRFLGVRLTTGEHTDAEGPSSDPLGELLCGTPQPGNVAALQQLATSWTGDYVEGATDYPTAAAAAFAAHLAEPLDGA